MATSGVTGHLAPHGPPVPAHDAQRPGMTVCRIEKPRSVLETIDLSPADPVRPEEIADRDAVFVDPQLHAPGPRTAPRQGDRAPPQVRRDAPDVAVSPGCSIPICRDRHCRPETYPQHHERAPPAVDDCHSIARVNGQ